MTTKWIGAMLVIAGCGGFGFSLAAAHRREVRELQGLLRSLEFMQWELTYRLTPLPELCAQAGREAGGVLMKVFSDLSGELNRQISPDVPSCMQVSLGRYRSALTPRGRKLLFQLGRSLGRFDLAGQLKSLKALQRACQDALVSLERDKDVRMRNYQTLGLCAGAALAIIFV